MIFLWTIFVNYFFRSVSKEDTMAEHCLWECPKKMGPSGTRPVPLAVRQWWTYRPGVNFILAWACPFRASNRGCMYGCLYEKCCKKGPTGTPPPGGRLWAPTVPSLTTNANRVVEAMKASPIRCQVNHQIVFHQDSLEFIYPVHTNKVGWSNLPSSAGAAHIYHALTKTAAPDNTTPVAIGRCKKTQITNNQRKFHAHHPY